ncbi:BNR-4 repeat-containing protein [Dyadobacter tibetensis]|uniref:BNR-4 repeat-containing protein n=1 Tax=Dyadobacter tibetensis TaxID=1211851 RepID=UPI000470D09D|nr:BNR-4 repeat-containing protein [Dyadobacter tibetensis]
MKYFQYPLPGNHPFILYLIVLVCTSASHGLIAQNLASEPLKTVEGYKGIWFTLGQFSEYGDKYSGGLGTYTAKHNPLAIYAPAVNKTFFVYGGTRNAKERHLLCMIGSFDHASQKVSKPVVVYDKNGVDDPHDNPSLALDQDGFLWVFVSGRGKTRPGMKYRSLKPYSTEGFEKISEEEMTYPQPKYVPGKGFIHFFTKYSGVRELYFETSADGITWTEDQKLAGIKRAEDKKSGHYQVTGQYGGKVVTFMNWHPDGDVDLRTNLYYLQSTDMGRTWTTVDGRPVEVPLSDYDSPALLREYFGVKKNVYVKDVDFDEEGNPIALYVIGVGHRPGPDNGPRQWMVMHYNGKDWREHQITTSDHNYDMGSLLVEDGVWTVVAPTTDTPQRWGAGGELVMWKSTDKGKTWKAVKNVTHNSRYNHNYVRKVMNGKEPFNYFWADGNPDSFTESRLYFGDKMGNVWELPYEMNGNEADVKKVRR